MSDGFTATVDAAGLMDALHRLGDTALRYTVPACKVSADSIQAEAQRRVRRATGETAEGIGVDELRSGEGYIVDAVNLRMPNLPLWIEGGTKQGKPRSHTDPGTPFFSPAIRLEASQHERRIADAIGEALAAEGLG